MEEPFEKSQVGSSAMVCLFVLPYLNFFSILRSYNFKVMIKPLRLTIALQKKPDEVGALLLPGSAFNHACC